MQTMSVAPVTPPAMPFEPPSARPEAEEPSTPFGDTFKKELAKPESRAADQPKGEEAKRAGPKAEDARESAKDAAAKNQKHAPAKPEEWAALLEGGEPAAQLEGLAAEEAGDPPELALDIEADPDASVVDASSTPLHPYAGIATPRSSDSPYSLEKRTAAAVELRAQRAEALTARGTEAADLRGAAAKSDAAASDALLSNFAERMTATETPASSLHSSALDGLGATAYSQRLTPAQAAAATAALQPPATARIDAPLGQSAWSDAFQQKVVWLVDRQQQHAELHLNPPHLGPVDVSLSMSEEGTNISFFSPHAAVREAIEASLADLKTALGERGLALGQATVGADSQAAREQLQEGARNGLAGSRGGRNADENAAELPVPPQPAARGLVDIFA